MILKLRRKEMITGIELVSTSDVAFLLLIFFIVATAFAADLGLTLLLPAKESLQPPVRVEARDLATLKIDADDSVTWDGAPIAVSRVRRAVAERLQQNPQLVVVLETHPAAGYGTMVACLDELKLARARRVSLKTSAPGGREP